MKMAAATRGIQCFCFQFLKYIYIYSVLLLLMFNLCFALYEDQVGLFDWRQKYIGNPKDVYFDQSSHSSKLLYIATDANVLAALNARKGHIVWRKVFERKDGVINKLLLQSNMLFTVSGNGQFVRSWDQSKGHLIWESTSSKFLKPDNTRWSYLTETMRDHQSVVLDAEEGGIAVITNNSVRLISQSDGTEIWEHVLKEKDDFVFGVAAVKNRIVAFCSKFRDNEIFLVFKYFDLETGKLMNEIVTPSPWIAFRSLRCQVFSGQYFSCFVPELHSIAVKNFANENRETFTMTNIIALGVTPEDVIDEPYMTSFSDQNDAGSILHVRINKRHSVLAKLNLENRSLRLVKTLKQPGFFKDFRMPNKHYIVSVYKLNSEHKLMFEIFEKENLEKPLQSLSAEISEDDNSAPLNCALYMYKKKDGMISFRILLLGEDYSISLVHHVSKTEAKVLWTRKEALSAISSVRMIELPPSTSASKLELLHAEFSVPPNFGVVSMFINRIKSQIRQIQTYAEYIKKRRNRLVSTGSSVEDNEDKETLKRDQFNIVKVILAYTKARRLFAMNSQNGEIVWSRFIPQIDKDTDGKVYIIEQRTSAHFPLPPQCLLVASLNRHLSKGVHKTVLFTFNPLTGEGLNDPVEIQDFDLLQVSVLPMEDEKSVQVVGLVDTTHKFHIYPDTPETRRKFKEKSNSFYVYLVNTTTNDFKGYKVESDVLSQIYEVWSVNIPEDQQIVRVTSKRADEVVNSVGRILGDHTVLYKYLNPNLLGIISQGRGQKGGLFVYVIDAVTGRVVYHAKHKGITSNHLEVILSEHWLVYLYYNPKGRRTEISVVEFYEGFEEKNHTAFSSLDPVEASMILSQGYILPVSGVSAMVSTTTERGITNKNLLFGLDNGYVYSLPKNFLDPRRQFKQTQMLQEEGVPPYIPELPLFPQAYINYNQTVEKIRGIHTSAAGLESTSLVIVYGLDIFYTRVTPSKMFDVLKEDFDYIFIAGVLSALILATVICSKLASMRSLKLAWK